MHAVAGDAHVHSDDAEMDVWKDSKVSLKSNSPGVSLGLDMEACRLVLLKDNLTAVAAEGRRDNDCKKLGRDCSPAGLGSVP